MQERSGNTPPGEPRGFPRSLAIVLLGPLVGAFLAFAYFMLFNLGEPLSSDDLFQGVMSLLLIILGVGWVAGLPAAAISALVWHFLEPRLSTAMRLPAALIVGALSSVATTLPVIYAVFGASIINLPVIAGIGALAMAATAVPAKKPS
jgi:hypothetical protein